MQTLCRWLKETCCVFYKRFCNIRTLKLCELAVNLPDLQYALRAVQQDLGAQMHYAQLRCAIRSIKQGAISGCKLKAELFQTFIINRMFGTVQRLKT